MANNSTDRTIQGGLWVMKQEYDIDGLPPKKEIISDYTIALLEVAAADGVLSEAERRWVVGLASATGKYFSYVKTIDNFRNLILGAPQDVLDELQSYQHKGMDSILKTFHVESGHGNAIHRQLSLIYDGFRAAGADGELHPKEIEAIYKMGNALGVDETKIKQLYELYLENQQNRFKRLSIIFPNGGNNAMAELVKLY